MQISNFKDMYLAELQELVSVEGRLADALPRLAEVASHQVLKSALTRHAEQALAQKRLLESILWKHGAKAGAHTDQAMQALVHDQENVRHVEGQRVARCRSHRIGPEARTL
jgi:ferritin-like metal-binding protein YciE